MRGLIGMWKNGHVRCSQMSVRTNCDMLLIGKKNRIWVLKSRNVTPIETIKFHMKISIWGMMSHRALSDHHFISRGQFGTSEYYVVQILI